MRYFTNRRVLDGSRGAEKKESKKSDSRRHVVDCDIRAFRARCARVMNNNQLLLPGRAINTQLTNTPPPRRNKGCHA